MKTKFYLSILISILFSTSCAIEGPPIVQEPWVLNGNTGTDPLFNFLGTNDNQPLIFRTQNIEKVRITVNGNIGVGTTNPAEKLVVEGKIRAQGTTGHLTINPNLTSSSSIIFAKNLNGYQDLLFDASNYEIKRSGNQFNSLTFNSIGLSVNGSGISIDRFPQQGKWNSRIPLPNSTEIVTDFDSRKEFGGGNFSSMTIGIDGLPIISYRKQENAGVQTTYGDLNVVHCGNSDCSEGNIITTLDSSVNTGYNTSISIAPDGKPVIVYQESNPSFELKNIKIVKCGNIYCSAGNSITTISEGKTRGVSSTIGINGFPVIAFGFYFTSSPVLEVIFCGNATCSQIKHTEVIASTRDVDNTSISIGADGLPVISYYDSKNSDLKILKYKTEEGAHSLTTLDSEGDVGRRSSITISLDGLPVMAYSDESKRSIKVIKCGNASCNFRNLISTVESNTIFGYPSITIGNDGFPVVSYINFSSELKVAKCSNILCSSKTSINSINILSNNLSVHRDHTSIAIGADGVPIVVFSGTHFKVGKDVIRLAKCGNDRCIPNWIRR